MEWMLSFGLVGLSIAIVLGLRWMIEANRRTVEMLIKGNEDTAGTLTRAMEATYSHLKEASPIGGLPRDLWIEQHELRKRELELRERQLDIETPLRQEALRAKLMKAHKLSGNGRVTNPEG